MLLKVIKQPFPLVNDSSVSFFPSMLWQTAREHLRDLTFNTFPGSESMARPRNLSITTCKKSFLPQDDSL